MDVGDDNYQAVTLKEVLRAVIDAVAPVTNRPARQAAPSAAAAAGTPADGSAKLTQAAYWQALQGYLRPGDVLFTDNGTSYAIFGFRLPPDCTVVASVIWGSIGYSVGALLARWQRHQTVATCCSWVTARSRRPRRSCRPCCGTATSR